MGVRPSPFAPINQRLGEYIQRKAKASEPNTEPEKELTKRVRAALPCIQPCMAAAREQNIHEGKLPSPDRIRVCFMANSSNRHGGADLATFPRLRRDGKRPANEPDAFLHTNQPQTGFGTGVLD